MRDIFVHPWIDAGDLARAQVETLRLAGCVCRSCRSVLDPRCKGDYAVLDWFDETGGSLRILVKRILLLMVMRIRGVRIVYVVDRKASIHGDPPAYFYFMRQALVRAASAIVCCCDSAKQMLEGQVGGTRYATIEGRISVLMVPPMWLDPRKHKTLGRDFRQEMGVGGDDFVFLNLGSISPYKSLDSMLDVAERFASEALPAVFVIAGTAEDEAYLRHIESRVVRLENVRLINRRIEAEELVDFTRSADVALLTHDTTLALSSASLVANSEMGMNVICPRFAVTEDMPEHLIYGFDAKAEEGNEGSLYFACRTAFLDFQNDPDGFRGRADKLRCFARDRWSKEVLARKWNSVFDKIKRRS